MVWRVDFITDDGASVDCCLELESMASAVGIDDCPALLHCRTMASTNVLVTGGAALLIFCYKSVNAARRKKLTTLSPQSSGASVALSSQGCSEIKETSLH